MFLVSWGADLGDKVTFFFAEKTKEITQKAKKGQKGPKYAPYLVGRRWRVPVPVAQNLLQLRLPSAGSFVSAQIRGRKAHFWGRGDREGSEPLLP